MLVAITLLPWYGRLVYDGVLVPAPATSATFQPPILACKDLKAKLDGSLEQAKCENRIIQKLSQLEVKGGSLAGLHDKLLKAVVAPTVAPPAPVPRPGTAADNKQPPRQANSTGVPESAPPSRMKPRAMAVPSTQTLQSPPTAEEQQLVNDLKQLPKTEVDRKDPEEGMPAHGMWVFRRFGLTEATNPKHGGMIMAGPRPLGPFRCHAGLKPSTVDILKPLALLSRKLRKCPAVVWVDDPQCAARDAVPAETNRRDGCFVL